MKIAEQATLRDYIESIDLICEKFLDAKDFYDNIDGVPHFSLQNTAYQMDMAFLREASQVLTVIASIISHPHIANKREEIVLRVEQASQLQQDDFKKVIQDSSLWKKHGSKMIPEEVYYHQHVDELRIYENQFIVLLVDLLDVELSKCNAFYLRKLPVVSAGDNADRAPLHSCISPKDSAEAIKLTDNLKRKLRFIKNSYFYKVVSVGKGISKTIKPTNILLKDRLYRKCFTFYLKFVRYSDEHSLTLDLAKYASVLILKVFKEQGFNLCSVKEGKYRIPEGVVRKLIKRSGKTIKNGVIIDDDGNEIVVNRAIAPFFNEATFTFTNNLFTIECAFMPESTGISLDIWLTKNHELKVSHALLFDGSDREINFKQASDFTSAEVFSIWNTFAFENNNKRLLSGDFTEWEMVEKWINSKLTVINGDGEIYAKYCPVCKTKGVEGEDNDFTCPICDTQYSVIAGGDDGQLAKLWLTNVRRV